MILGATITGSLILNGVNLSSITGSEASINALNSFTASAATTGSNVFKSNQTVTGSVDITGSLTVVGPITGTVTTASYVLNAVSASYALNATTASYALVSTSASYAANSDLLDGRDSLTFANTGSNSFVGTQNINGDVAITGSLTTTGAITAQTLNVQQVTSSIVYSSGSNIFGNSVSNTQSMTGSVGISGSLAVVGASTITGILTLNSTITNGTYTYTLPSATGTLALTSAIPANPVGGTGTTNYVPKFTGASAIGDSALSDGGAIIVATNRSFQTTGNGNYLRAGNYLWAGGSGGDYGSVGYNQGYTTTTTTYNYVFTDYASILRFDSGGFKFLTAPIGTAGAAITFTPAMTLTASGRLLIGTPTEATYMLDVNGTGRFTNTLTITGTSNSKINLYSNFSGGNVGMSFFNTSNVENIYFNSANGSINCTGPVNGGAATFSGNVTLGTIGGGSGTATPLTINLTSTFSTTAGSNLKLKLFEDTGGNIYGIGVSNGQMDFNVPSGGSYKFFTGAATFASSITAPSLYGNSYAQTSTSGTTSFVNTGIFYNTSIIGFANNSMYNLVISGNPNGAGSSEYRSVYLGYIFVTTGYDFGISSVVQRISYTQVITGDAYNIGALTISVVFWDGTTETTQQTNGTTNNQIRVKITGYNSGNIGAAQTVLITKVN
jgi:hypothetical protein